MSTSLPVADQICIFIHFAVFNRGGSGGDGGQKRVHMKLSGGRDRGIIVLSMSAEIIV